MARLSVNIDHIATIRQARKANEPDPVAAAVIAELAGAEGITCHIRGDRRHINDDDLRRLREVVTTPLNVEMAPTAEMLKIARKIKPDLVTIVPERPGEVTTEGGIDASRLARKLASHIRALKRAGLGVSLFIDPEEKQIKAALKLDVAVVELNTNAYSSAKTSEEAAAAYDVLVDAAEQADEAGLVVAAGHGLTVRNVGPVAAIPEIGELNIGHSIVARAALIGLERSVREMREAIAAAELY